MEDDGATPCWPGHQSSAYCSSYSDDECFQDNGEDAQFQRHLDLEEQRYMVDEDRWRSHTMWCEKQMEATRFSVNNRRIALKILLCEAFRRDRQSLVANGGNTEDLQRVREKWRAIGRAVMHDMHYQDNSATVLRKLSSMSVFITGQICHQYGENAEERRRRQERQYEFIRELQYSGSLFKPGSSTCN